MRKCGRSPDFTFPTRGDFYKVLCPSCGPALALRATPLAEKLRCTLCRGWVSADNIVSFAYSPMLDSEETEERS